MSTTKHIAIIGYVWPEPDSSAAGQNMTNLLNLFVEAGWHVSFICAANDSIHAPELTSMGVTPYLTFINDDSFDTLISDLSPDLVIFDRFMIEEQFSWRVKRACPDAMLVLNTEDLHSLRHARQIAVKAGSNARDAVLNNDMALREVAAILRCDITLVISRAELALLCQHYGVSRTQLLYFPLHLPDTTAKYPSFSAREGFMTIGNFRHEPNWDSVRYIREQLWPSIRKQLPEAKCYIYGAYPAKKVTNLHNEKLGFLVKGWVNDAHEAISQHRVMLAPLRFGAGIKGKLISAMQTRTPSVTTWVGAEGFCENTPWPGAIANNPQTQIQQAISLHQEQTLWENAVSGTVNVLNEYTNNGTGRSALLPAIDEGLSNLKALRQANFNQQMLWHHTLRSAQFMGQWITAKNQVIE